MTKISLRNTIKCKEDGCEEWYYSRGLCRRHYKMLLGREGGYIKDYAKRKNDPKYREMKRKADKIYKQRLRENGLLQKLNHEQYIKIKQDPVKLGKKLARNKKYYLSNKEIIRPKQAAMERRRRDEVKLEVLKHYSGESLSCAWCGIDVYPVLTLDHINDDGADHKRKLGIGRKSKKASNTEVYLDLINNNFPQGYQVLCFNCNFLKDFIRRVNG